MAALAIGLAAIPRTAEAVTPGRIQLVSTSVKTQGDRAARIDLAFAPQTPRYEIHGVGTPHLTLTLNGAGVPSPPTIDTTAAGFTTTVKTDAAGIVFDFTSAEPMQLQVQVDSAQLHLLIFVHGPRVGVSGPAVTPTSPVAGDVTTVALALKYADVAEVAAVLGQTLLPDVQQTGMSAPLSGPAGPVQTGYAASAVVLPQSPPLTSSSPIGAKLGEGLSIDRRLNAVIVTGPPATIARYRQMLSVIDRPMPSVLLEASIVELTATAAKSVGIDFAPSGQFGAAAVTVKSGSVADGTLNLQAAIYAQVQHGNGRIVARPKVLASNTMPASIVTGDAIPIVTAISYPGSGSNIVQQQVQYVNVGVTLDILPRISADGTVFARISAEVSSVTDYIQGFPRISQRRASTTATVKDGQALVVGGLMQDSDLSAVQKVPGLGDLPIIGGLFRLRRDSRQRADLYIVITPHVINAEASPQNDPSP